MSRYLVTRKATGIGSDLLSVVCALNYAIQTGRHLVIDWRHSRYLSEPMINLFDKLFTISPNIEGCEVKIAEADFDDTCLPSPILLSKNWPFSDYHFDMLGGHDRPEPSLIITRPMHHLPSSTRQAELLAHIRPKHYLLERIEQFRQEKFLLKRTVGIHVRHGNGEVLLGNRDLLISNGIDNLFQRTLDGLKRLDITDPTLFLCTDSSEVRGYFQKNINNVVHWSSELSESDHGPIHTKDFGLAGAEDAVIEMWLLGKTDGLIFNPSWFSHFARVTGHFKKPPVNIDNNSLYGTVDLYHEQVSVVEAAHQPSWLKLLRKIGLCAR